MKKDQNPIEDKNMKRKINNTQKSPNPIGPYNQAVLSDKTLYISGQIALDPETMKLKNDSIEVETNQKVCFQRFCAGLSQPYFHCFPWFSLFS